MNQVQIADRITTVVPDSRYCSEELEIAISLKPTRYRKEKLDEHDNNLR